MFWRKKKKPTERKKLMVDDLMRVQLARRKCPSVPCSCIECPVRFKGLLGGCENIPWHMETCSVCRMNASNGMGIGFIGECSAKKRAQGEFNEKKKGRPGEVIFTDDINDIPEPDGARLPSIDEILF